jgi:tetratricopeptide (TPR) repeat protein
MADTGEWIVLSLDETLAKRHGMPQRMPMPKAEFEELGLQGLTHDTAQRHVRQFLAKNGPTLRKTEPDTFKRYEAYLAKMPFWDSASKAFQRGDFERTIKDLELVASVDKLDFAARKNLATAYAAAGRSEESRKLFQEIAAVWAGSAEFHVAYGNVLLVAGEREEALEQFVAALEADPSCQPAMEGLVSLGFLVKMYEDPLSAASLVFVRKDSIVEHLEATWAGAELPVEHFLRVAGYHEDEGRYEVMLGAVERALALEPNRVESALAKSRALRLLGQLEAAKQFVAEKLAANPSPALLAELAQCERDLGNLDAARATVQRALDADPGHLRALELLFLPDGSDRLERAEVALAAVQDYAAAHPQAVGAWRLLGRLCARIENAEGADAAFQRALECTPGDDDLRAEYWNALMRRGEFQRVLDQATTIDDMAKKDWRLRWSEADAYHGLGRAMEARAAFTAINADTSLHVVVRARAKRAVERMAGA